LSRRLYPKALAFALSAASNLCGRNGKMSYMYYLQVMLGRAFRFFRLVVDSAHCGSGQRIEPPKADPYGKKIAKNSE
jgi:hypothetical protein